MHPKNLTRPPKKGAISKIEDLVFQPRIFQGTCFLCRGGRVFNGWISVRRDLMNHTEPLPVSQGTLGSAEEPKHRGVVGYVVGHFFGIPKGRATQLPRSLTYIFFAPENCYWETQ